MPEPVAPPIETPASLAEAFAILATSTPDDQVTPIAGGTDVMVRITGEIGEPPTRMLDLSRLDDLRGIAIEGSTVVLGALTTYTEIRRSGICREHLPALVEAAATIGAVQIQNRATIGGNAANASPAGDTLPVLLALDASFVVGGPRGERTIAAHEFWTAYRRTALSPDELVLSVRIPLLGGREMRFRKIGTRRAQAISKVVLAVAWQEELRPAGAGYESEPAGSSSAAAAGRPWREVRVALGSVADRPIRAVATEAQLEGRPPTPETADAAAETLADEIQPIDDVRSTAEYRRAVAARALHRIVRDAGGW
ncbi:MAG TPA: xanthine dehydrogenase family protein subunit M [Candidatus Limnocylindrales bacterium]|nr:xanthine dehydrogenase family protein subunit M [Candidatus Limnocylindrales bacterium]